MIRTKTRFRVTTDFCFAPFLDSSAVILSWIIVSFDSKLNSSSSLCFNSPTIIFNSSTDNLSGSALFRSSRRIDLRSALLIYVKLISYLYLAVYFSELLYSAIFNLIDILARYFHFFGNLTDRSFPEEKLNDDLFFGIC